MTGPKGIDRIGRRVVAEHHDVEFIEIDMLRIFRRLQFGQELIKRFVAFVTNRAGNGVDRPIAGTNKVADAERIRLVASVRGSHRQARGRVRGQLGLDVVNDEGDFHGRRIPDSGRRGQGALVECIAHELDERRGEASSNA